MNSNKQTGINNKRIGENLPFKSSNINIQKKTQLSNEQMQGNLNSKKLLQKGQSEMKKATAITGQKQFQKAGCSKEKDNRSNQPNKENKTILPKSFTLSSKNGIMLNIVNPNAIVKIDNSTQKESCEVNAKNEQGTTSQPIDLKTDEENDKKLKEYFQIYSSQIRKNEGGGLNTLFKIRTILLNWLKDSEQDNLEYTKFMTEKKIKYLMKNRDKSEARMKVLEQEISSMASRKIELEDILGEMFLHYEVEELTVEIQRFANSYEIKNGKSQKMLEKFEEMKRMLPFVQEINKIREQETAKTNEKKELEKICKNSGQTLLFLTNYYKNLKKKINDFGN